MMGVGIGVWGLGISESDAQADALSFVSNPQPPTANPRAAASRRGITLLEVLISMFVLLIGLMGVGAMIPAGRFDIKQGVKTDYGTTVGRAAFRDLKVRRYLNPLAWSTLSGATLTPAATPSPIPPFTPTAFSNGSNTAIALSAAYVIDPLGVARGFPAEFPAGAAAPVLSRVVPYSNPPAGFTGVWPFTLSPISMQNVERLTDPIFRCTDDLVTLPSLVGRDSPPVQSSVPFNRNPLLPDVPIMSRSSEGNYSWLATIVSDPNSSALDSKVTMSVAVFYKRDFSSPGAKEATAAATPLGGSEFRIDLSLAPQFPEGLRPGQWIMLAGTTGTQRVFRWYRVQGAAKVTAGTQEISLAGADWNPALATTAWMFEGVIAVNEKNMQLEIE
jgi:hypothetical protein